MSIKEALKEAIALLETVKVEPGRNNMKRQIAAIDRIEAVIIVFDNAEKEEAAHEDHHDQQREDA